MLILNGYAMIRRCPKCNTRFLLTENDVTLSQKLVATANCLLCGGEIVLGWEECPQKIQDEIIEDKNGVRKKAALVWLDSL